MFIEVIINCIINASILPFSITSTSLYTKLIIEKENLENRFKFAFWCKSVEEQI